MKNHHQFMIFFLFYGVICFTMMLLEGSLLYGMLLWNIILATLPLFFMSRMVRNLNNHRKFRGILSFTLWLAFFPNAIYMITDFIHISNDKLIWSVRSAPYEGLNSTRYSMEILKWSKLLVISLGAVYALMVGLESLSRLYEHLRNSIGGFRSLISIALISILSSFGVFIGRFLRFNSWDLLKPGVLMGQVIRSLDGFALMFTLVYTAFVLATFWLHRWYRSGSRLETGS